MGNLFHHFFAQAGFCSSCKRLGIEQNNVGKRKAISQGVSYLRPVDPVSKGWHFLSTAQCGKSSKKYKKHRNDD